MSRPPAAIKNTVPSLPAAGASKRLPDFIGIGAIKSGTTWLWACLREHPDIFMPAMKELEFFDTRYKLGLEWYSAFFSEASMKLCGEISPQYMHDPRALERMAFLAGSVRLVVALRHPVDRAFSHFLMDAREWPDASNRQKLDEFRRIIAKPESKYIRFGLYARQLEPVFETFGPERIHAVLFDDIQAEPRRVIRGVLEFLGADPGFVPSKIETPVNAAKRYRSPKLFKALRGAVQVGERLGLSGAILHLKKTAVRDKVIAMLEVDEGYEPLPMELRRELTSYYRADIQALEGLIGRDLGGWLSR